LAVGVVAIFMSTAMLFGAEGAADYIVLAATIFVSVVATVPLARHLWDTPSNFPEHKMGHIPSEASSDAPGGPLAGPPQPVVEEIIDRYATRWTSDTRRVDLPNPTVRK
jgi:hypothetical protein